MTIREQVRAELEKVGDEHLTILCRLIQSLEVPAPSYGAGHELERTHRRALRRLHRRGHRAERDEKMSTSSSGEGTRRRCLPAAYSPARHLDVAGFGGVLPQFTGFSSLDRRACSATSSYLQAQKAVFARRFTGAQLMSGAGQE